MIYKFLNIGIIMCFNLTCINVFSQSERHSLNVYTGYSIGQPDKRYDFLYGKLPLGPVQTVINKSGRTTPDDEYSVGLSYRYNLRDRVKLGFGIGYAILIQDFLLPADGNGYFMQSIKPFFWRDKSHYHMIQCQPVIDIKVLRKPYVIGFNCAGISNISFRKHINRFNLSRNKVEYFATEVYSGAYGVYNDFRLDIGFRVFHWKYRDDAIANNGLNPDRHNPYKIRVLLSYVFWQK